MKTIVVLAMHGSPPTDFPPADLGEFFALHLRVEASHGAAPPEILQQFQALEFRLRAWPRNKTNDPFYAGSLALGRQLEAALGHKVIVGFNEFCAPSLAEAFAAAVEHGADQVVVATPMMTRGGEHSETDIPEAVDAARRRYPDVIFRYAWPFEPGQVAAFLAKHIEQHLMPVGEAEPGGGKRS